MLFSGKSVGIKITRFDWKYFNFCCVSEMNKIRIELNDSKILIERRNKRKYFSDTFSEVEKFGSLLEKTTPIF